MFNKGDARVRAHGWVGAMVTDNADPSDRERVKTSPDLPFSPEARGDLCLRANGHSEPQTRL